MEGGTDHDLRILDLPSEEEEEREKSTSASGGAEAPKREDLKALEGDRKPSVERDKNEKVCVVLLLCLQAVEISQCCDDDSKLCHRRRVTLPAQRELLQLKGSM